MAGNVPMNEKKLTKLGSRYLPAFIQKGLTRHRVYSQLQNRLWWGMGSESSGMCSIKSIQMNPTHPPHPRSSDRVICGRNPASSGMVNISLRVSTVVLLVHKYETLCC